jgi:hypothetical protein
LKKEAKTFARLSPTTPRQPYKSFFGSFFQKRTLPYFPMILTTKSATCPKAALEAAA